MKIFLACILSMSAFVAAASAQNAQPGDVKITKIEPQGVKTPEFQIIGGAQKRYKLGTWLEVEVAYDTKAEMIDELTFNYTIMIDGTLCDGSVTYVNIPKGREHYAVMYIPPRTLDRLTGGKTLTGGDIQNVWVRATHQGQEIDTLAFKPMQPPNAPHEAGLVLNKNETPFAPLYYDRYEAIKAATR